MTFWVLVAESALGQKMVLVWFDPPPPPADSNMITWGHTQAGYHVWVYFIPGATYDDDAACLSESNEQSHDGGGTYRG